MKDKTSLLVTLVIAGFVITILMRLFARREGFAQQTVGMPVDGGGMGLYDGLDLSSFGNLWGSSPKPTPLKPYENANDNEIMKYQNSKFSPECCPSSITSDVGCLCPTKEDEREWLTRGGNRISM
jgi:hypothetical protein